MNQSVRQIDAVRRIDAIMDQTTVKAISSSPSQLQTEQSADFLNQSKEEKGMLTKEYLESMSLDASEAIAEINTSLHFRVHEGTGRPLIQLVETGTDNVVREIPPEKMLDIVAGIWEWAGLFVDRKE